MGRSRGRGMNRLHTEHGTGHGAQSHNGEIATWAEIKGLMFYQLSHPGAPCLRQVGLVLLTDSLSGMRPPATSSWWTSGHVIVIGCRDSPRPQVLYGLHTDPQKVLLGSICLSFHVSYSHVRNHIIAICHISSRDGRLLEGKSLDHTHGTPFPHDTY